LKEFFTRCIYISIFILALIWAIVGIDLEPLIVLLGSLISIIGFKSLSKVTSGVGFNCGTRLKAARKQIGYKPSEIVDILGLKSETEYLQMESGKIDVSNEVIQKYADTFGLNMAWIKHGSSLSMMNRLNPYAKVYDECNPSYIRHELDIWSEEGIENALKKIFFTQPQHLYLCVEPENPRCLILLGQYSRHYWKIYDLNSLDFWELGWQFDAKYIPFIRPFLKKLQERAGFSLSGLYANNNNMIKLYCGNTYPGSVVKDILVYEHKTFNSKYSNISHWPTDIIDIRYKNSSKSTYKKWYGDWFVKSQNCILEALEQHS